MSPAPLRTVSGRVSRFLPPGDVLPGLGPFLAEVVARTPDVRQYHRAGFFTDGRRATWEYPRDSPDGEQMDFVEVMEIEDGLIHAHRVYWGWKGVDMLSQDQYHRS